MDRMEMGLRVIWLGEHIPRNASACLDKITADANICTSNSMPGMTGYGSNGIWATCYMAVHEVGHRL